MEIFFEVKQVQFYKKLMDNIFLNLDAFLREIFKMIYQKKVNLNTLMVIDMLDS